MAAQAGTLGPGRRTARSLGVVALAVALFLAGGIGLLTRGGGPSSDRSTSPTVDHGAALAGHPVIGSGTLDGEIESLQERLAAVPGDARSWAYLGLAYVQQARVTADPSFYPKAEGALRRSLSLQREGNFEAFTGLGALALARHDFAGALRWGERARSVNPFSGSAYGVIGDAQIELGRYPAAFDTFQRMVDLRPDIASYARVSYARELQGDVPGAVEAMSLALQAAGTPEDRAFAAFQLGELEFNRGNVEAAARWYEQAAQLAPDYVPPKAGLAKAAWARGDVDRAIRLYRAVASRSPLPEHVIALGDLYASVGETALASRQYSLVRAEERLFQAAGVNVDLELALFDADHGSVRAALRTARAEWSRRHSILVADALAWALHRNGRDAEALRYVRLADRLGYRGALLRFHAGMIELGLGRDGAARRDLRAALRINPHFSISFAPEAERTLARLEPRG